MNRLLTALIGLVILILAIWLVLVLIEALGLGEPARTILVVLVALLGLAYVAREAGLR